MPVLAGALRDLAVVAPAPKQAGGVPDSFLHVPGMVPAGGARSPPSLVEVFVTLLVVRSSHACGLLGHRPAGCSQRGLL